MHRFLLLLTVSLICLDQVIALPLAVGGKDPEGIAYFEKRIRPLLAEHCYECHSESGKIKGGLALDTEAGWMDGGDSGEVILPKKPGESLLLKAISHKDNDLQMPPKYKLSDAEIEALTHWVKIGAPDPRDETAKTMVPKTKIDIENGRKFWAFQRPANATPPAEPGAQNWTRDPIDQFVYSGLVAKGIKPVADADRRTLIRRATFDLIGLPPTPKEIDSFVKDPAPQQIAFAKVVDRLLASPHYGERWGRHWMDLARYAESMGRTRNWPFPFAWRYRDYVINAFNVDMRYNRFLAEQLAGDLLPAKTDAQKDRQLIATGFLTLGSMDLNERDAKVYKADQIDEQIDVTARSILGLTVACARCHDHKFDPIPTADYYALAGIFGSTEVRSGLKNRGGGGNNGYLNAASFARLSSAGNQAPADSERQEKNGRIAKLRKESQAMQAEIKKLNGNKKTKNGKEIKKLRGDLKKLNQQIAKLNKNGGGNAKLTDDLVMAAGESKKPINWRINIKGDPKNLGAEIERGVPKVLVPQGGSGLTFPPDASGRLELAKWITSTEHPLTSRVMVNRIWHHLFGQGIVRTVDNFGETGERPSDQALLDHLALRFANDNAWSIKKTIREIMLTRTYQLGSEFDRENFLADPENRLHWRANVRRLEAEAIRDSLLAISGNLDRAPMQASPVKRMKGGEIGRNTTVPNGGNFTKRSIYMPIIRNYVPPVLETFDFAEPSAVIGKRDVTTVSTQALYMMNNPFVLKQAKSAAERLEKQSADPFARVQAIYLNSLGRRATKEEVDRAVTYVNSEGAKGWPALYQAVFASSEFRYVQ